MGLRHALGQRYFHLHYLLQYHTKSVASEYFELLLKFVTGVERNIPPEEQTSQHKFLDWR